MKITYLKLENVAGLYVGGNRSSIEIDFSKSKNKIIAISGSNGVGKSVLISSLHPFASVTSLDERSTLPYILQNKDGYKEIHFENNKDYYIIKHYFKANKGGSHSVKSYIMKNGVELNENGNVTSFNSLIEIHMGLTQEMMRLIRIGSNVNSIVTLTPARRKEYIGKLIEDIDLYMSIYKKINDDIRVLKVLIQTNTNNLYNYHIDDVILEENKLKNLNKEIIKKDKDKEELISKISNLDNLIKDNDINELRDKEIETSAKLKELSLMEEDIDKYNLSNVSIDDLINKRNDISNNKIDIQSKINSFRISIDTALRNIERLETMIQKVSSNQDINTLLNTIKEFRFSIDNTPDIIKTFRPMEASSNEVNDLVSKLNSYNQISKMIYTFGNKSINKYIKLRTSKKNIDKWIKEQIQKNVSRLNQNDIQFMFDKLFKEDDILTPNCDTEYKECPYYRFSELFTEIKDNFDTEVFDEEDLRYIQIISNNIDNLLNDVDLLKRISIPDRYKEMMKENNIISRLNNHLPFFDTSYIQEYLSLLKNYEIYKFNVEKLKDYEHQLSVYKKSGVDSYMDEINILKESINQYKNNINDSNTKLDKINEDLNNIDKQIGLVTKYNDNKRYKDILISTLENTKKLLGPLETANNERSELNFQLREMNNDINTLRNLYNSLSIKITEYHKLLAEGKKLSKMKDDLDIILESVGTKKGIPVLYMKKYLGKIQKLTNDLLSLIYGGNLKLSNFNISRESFEIPYIKNGKKIPDIKYASQSELAMTTMAVSFALATNTSKYYNILLLDEVDAGLDETNRFGFMKMLYSQMDQINSDQIFIISQNLSQMLNIPMDVILLSERSERSDLENIIYE